MYHSVVIYSFIKCDLSLLPLGPDLSYAGNSGAQTQSWPKRSPPWGWQEPQSSGLGQGEPQHQGNRPCLASFLVEVKSESLSVVSDSLQPHGL